MHKKDMLGPSPPAGLESDGDAQIRRQPDFRFLLSQFASGLVVLAAAPDGEPVGMTCQSFFSQSLEPPLVAMSVARTSATLPELTRSGRLAANILAAGQEGVARQFGARGIDRWAGIQWRRSEQGNPWISGALAWIDCTIVQTFDAGDHTVLIGLVEDSAVSEDPRKDPLLFFRGGFQTARAMADAQAV